MGKTKYYPYYKIKYMQTPTWSLREAAYILSGEDPNNPISEIAHNYPNYPSKIYYWLKNKQNKSELYPSTTVEGIEYFNTGSILRLINSENKFKMDDDLNKLWNSMYSPPEETAKKRSFSNSVYRRAAEIIFDKYPKATRMDVATILVELPKHFNHKERGYINEYQATTIMEHLKNLNTNETNISQKDKPMIFMSLEEVVELM